MENFGCLPSKKDLRNYQIKATASQVEAMPNEFVLPCYGKVKNQGVVGSCVAHTFSSILEYHNKGQNQLSTNFIYGIKRQLFNDKSPGMSLSNACKIVSKYGDMLETDCSGNDEVPYSCNKADTAFDNKEKLDRAYVFRVKYYFTCETESDIKLALQKYGPVAVRIPWYKGSKAKSDGTLVYNTAKDKSYHCIMIYGWTSEGFVCQNSYGKSWGNSGSFILPYDYERSDVYALVDEYNPDEESLIIPKRNWFLDIFYRVINWCLNISI